MNPDALPRETDDLTVQIDIFGAEHAPEPEPPAYCRPAGKTEQRRLFEPQLAGQLDLTPECGADAPER